MLIEENLVKHDLSNNENHQEPAFSINKNDKILQSLIDNLTTDLERVINKAIVSPVLDGSVENFNENNEFARLKRSQPLTG